jgi:2-keto-4-pentenoate hydratase/2-oxohepta-3-ene-1,7-dioic acid hydratase in catechol pathway
MPQMVAHHTAGGCPLRPGDLLGTGTLSHAVSAGILVVPHVTATCAPHSSCSQAGASREASAGV